MTHLKPRAATEDELARVHCRDYIARVRQMSGDDSKGHHTVGHQATFAPGGYDIAALAAGGALVALEAVMRGEVHNAYALTRPPGHHAERAEGMGFCIFNNVAVAAAAAVAVHGLRRVAVVDFDVHHGNGTQRMFESDPCVLFVSLHQDSNYPLHS
ncbi:Histone deacetylase 10, partial [Tetrabaena socialis]